LFLLSEEKGMMLLSLAMMLIWVPKMQSY